MPDTARTNFRSSSRCLSYPKGKISLSELVDSMQSLGFHDKNPMMFEMVNKISAKHDGGKATFPQFAEDLADLIVRKALACHDIMFVPG